MIFKHCSPECTVASGSACRLACSATTSRHFFPPSSVSSRWQACWQVCTTLSQPDVQATVWSWYVYMNRVCCIFCIFSKWKLITNFLLHFSLFFLSHLCSDSDIINRFYFQKPFALVLRVVVFLRNGQCLALKVKGKAPLAPGLHHVMFPFQLRSLEMQLSMFALRSM